MFYRMLAQLSELQGRPASPAHGSSIRASRALLFPHKRRATRTICMVLAPLAHRFSRPTQRVNHPSSGTYTMTTGLAGALLPCYTVALIDVCRAVVVRRL